MKAILVLFALFVVAMGVLAAQPVTPAVSVAAAHSTEPVWMVLSGVTLLAAASAVRRLVP